MVDKTVDKQEFKVIKTTLPKKEVKLEVEVMSKVEEVSWRQAELDKALISRKWR